LSGMNSCRKSGSGSWERYRLKFLQSIIKSRFGVDVAFDDGSIVYKETIANTVEGVGHFEPLRHYAEVHLLLSPERGEAALSLM